MTNQEKFIERVAPVISLYANKYGYKIVSTIIAQACIESAYGTSSLAYKHNNYFGMKCGSIWQGKSVNLSTQEEYTVGTLTTIRDAFRVYDTIDEGIEGYFIFISTDRYKKLKDCSNYKEYARTIKDCGYATSSTYVKTLCKVVEQYNLTRFDNQEVIPTYKVGYTYRTIVNNLNIRTGASVKYPKVPYSELTKSAKANSKDSMLFKGAEVTVKDILQDEEGNTWLKIPSGYICAIYHSEIYVR